MNLSEIQNIFKNFNIPNIDFFIDKDISFYKSCGKYNKDKNIILINKNLNTPNAITTLIHEVGHHIYENNFVDKKKIKIFFKESDFKPFGFYKDYNKDKLISEYFARIIFVGYFLNDIQDKNFIKIFHFMNKIFLEEKIQFNNIYNNL